MRLKQKPIDLLSPVSVLRPGRIPLDTLDATSFASRTWLIFGMALATLPIVTHIPIWIGLGVLLIGLLHLLGSRRNGGPAPQCPRWLKALITIAVVLLLTVTGQAGLGLEGATPFFVAMLWLKLLELNSARDFGIVCFLSLFLVAVTLLVWQTLFMMFNAILTTAVILGGIVHLNASRGSLKNYFFFQSLRTSTILCVQSLPLALLGFLLIPRPEVRWNMLSNFAMTGVTDTLDPGAIARLSTDGRPAFQAAFSDNDIPAPAHWFWRGINLAATDGNIWKKSAHLPKTDILLAPHDPSSTGKTFSYTVILEPHYQCWLFTLDTPVIGIQNARTLPGMMMERTQRVDSAISYKASSRIDASPADGSLSQLREYLEYPGNADSRILELAQSFVKKARDQNDNTDPKKLSDLILEYFSTQGFVYTREPGETGSNATATFLFERKRGFCGHYASAYALLMRMAGIPARVIVGYRGGELNPFGNFIMVRQSDAHAWCEVLLSKNPLRSRNEGWKRIDPTAAVTLADAGVFATLPTDPLATPDGENWNQSNWFMRTARKMSQTWAYLEFRWNYWVLGYDAQSRTELLQRLGMQWIKGWRLALLVPLPLLALLTFYFLIMRRRRLAGDPLVLLYDRFCGKLAVAGVARLPHEGPLAFSERAARKFPDKAKIIQLFCERYAQAHYGPPDVEALRELRGLLKRGLI